MQDISFLNVILYFTMYVWTLKKSIFNVTYYVHNSYLIVEGKTKLVNAGYCLRLTNINLLWPQDAAKGFGAKKLAYLIHRSFLWPRQGISCLRATIYMIDWKITLSMLGTHVPVMREPPSDIITSLERTFFWFRYS